MEEGDAEVDLKHSLNFLNSPHVVAFVLLLPLLRLFEMNPVAM
jgi:hypothetical protein